VDLVDLKKRVRSVGRATDYPRGSQETNSFSRPSH